MISVFNGSEASMLSAETIKEHDVRQNAGAQRLLKADGKWMWSGSKNSGILIGFSIITIHFGVPLFLETPMWS